MIGVYVHIPFCLKKCGYCNFYSVCDMSAADSYVKAVCDKINEYNFIADTLYIGGGTPSQMTSENLVKIINTAKKKMIKGSEITVEVNPGDDLENLIPQLKMAGVNRVSIGMQSANDNELKLLGRRHNFSQVEKAVETVKQNGITNFSLDLMLGIENQTKESLINSIEFAKQVSAPHISAYMLKIEEGTPFAKNINNMKLPDEDATVKLYNVLCDQLEMAGYNHYEISNFSKIGYESKHNLKYWRCGEYLGIGSAAHSYFNGDRFYYKDDITSFINNEQPIYDGKGGDIEEYIMLGLRLKEGINLNRLDESTKTRIIKKAENLKEFVIIDNNRLSLNRKGFLLSNSIIAQILY